MNISSKFGLAILALALSCGPILSQDGPQAPPAAEPNGPGRAMGPGGPNGGHGQWSQRRTGFERGQRGPRGEFGLSRLLSDPEIQQKVGVTPEQVAKIRQQESTFRKAEIRQRADLQVKRVDLRDLLAADKPDRAAIDAKLQDISTSQLALEKSRVNFRLDMRAALTADQREKLRQATRDRWQGRGRGGHRGPAADNGMGPDEPGFGPPPDEPGETHPSE